MVAWMQPTRATAWTRVRMCLCPAPASSVTAAARQPGSQRSKPRSRAGDALPRLPSAAAMTETAVLPHLDGSADIERAANDLAERLPASLTPLAHIAYNYLWSWTPHGGDLFAAIDAD